MVDKNSCTVEVVYASLTEQCIIKLNTHVGVTLEAVIVASGILQRFPEIDLTQQKIGVFSQPKKLTDSVQADDRVEIYRPLQLDPKDARRKKALRLKT